MVEDLEEITVLVLVQVDQEIHHQLVHLKVILEEMVELGVMVQEVEVEQEQ